MFLIVSGKKQSDIPMQAYMGNYDCVVSPSGYMDEKLFQAWLCSFLQEKNQIMKEKAEESEFSLLIVDGHNSQMNPATLFSVILQKVIVFAGCHN